MLLNAPLATVSGTAPTFVRPCWLKYDDIPAPPLFAARVGRGARCAAGVGSIMSAHSSRGGTASAPAAPSGAVDRRSSSACRAASNVALSGMYCTAAELPCGSVRQR